MDVNWPSGCLSGTNMASYQSDLLIDLDIATATEWVDKHCAKNPSDDVTDAAKKMLNQLNRDY